MKTKTMVLFLILAGLQFGTVCARASGSQPTVREVAVAVNDVYIPSGQTSRSEAYVVASGVFPNGCYKWKGVEVQERSRFVREIRSKAYVTQGMCIMVLIPFTKEVKLGNLESGEHKLRFVSGDGTYIEKTLKID